MLLKPLSASAFFAALTLGGVAVMAIGLSEAVVQPMFETPQVQDFVRMVVVPLFV